MQFVHYIRPVEKKHKMEVTRLLCKIAHAAPDVVKIVKSNPLLTFIDNPPQNRVPVAHLLNRALQLLH